MTARPQPKARVIRLAITAIIAWSLVAPARGLAAGRPIVFVPLDDRPVTYQLPVMLGAIAGRPVLTPPRKSLGHYLLPGDPEAILEWLRSPALADASAIVASLDMIGYGGLVASRVPGQGAYLAYARLRSLAAVHTARPSVSMDTFGTVMRLAPTGVPETAHYWATGRTVDDIAAYAKLPPPPRPAAQQAEADRVRARIGQQTLDAYVGARLRNRSVDEFELQLAAEGGFDRVVLGQDDAGPIGLHVADLAALNATMQRFGLGRRAALEPGADELGMILLARVLARDTAWSPIVRVHYSRSGAAAVIDPLEFAPIDVTIDKLIVAGGATRDDGSTANGIDLFVRVPETPAVEEASFVDGIAAAVARGGVVAVADLTFLQGPMPSLTQQSLVRELVERKLAGRIDAFASWNTNANTVGTALAAAIAAGSGHRSGTFDARAHAQFMLDRYVDDYAFHQFVRPVLNEQLRSRDVDTTLLTPPVALETEEKNRALLWPIALDLLNSIYPEYRDAGLAISLPWQRTFETQLDVRLNGGG